MVLGAIQPHREAQHTGEDPDHPPVQLGIMAQLARLFHQLGLALVVGHIGNQKHLHIGKAAQPGMLDDVSGMIVIVVKADILSHIVQQGGILQDLPFEAAIAVEGDGLIKNLQGEAGHMFFLR